MGDNYKLARQIKADAYDFYALIEDSAGVGDEEDIPLPLRFELAKLDE